MFTENRSTERVDLDLPDDRHAGPFEPKIRAADACEEAEHLHSSRFQFIARAAGQSVAWASSPAHEPSPSSSHHGQTEP